MSAITYPLDNTLVIGELSHYHFYQPINHAPHPSSKYQPRKRIIPPVPRQHSKAPVNSPLSFIRQQKVPQRNRSSISTPSSLGSPSSVNLLSPPSSSIEISTTCSTEKTTNSTQQRPPMFAHSSADLLTNLAPSPTKRPLDRGRRPRKVSFNENVMVICTRFDGDEDDKDTYDTDDDTTDNGQTNSRLIYQGRRHSTGEHIMVDRRQRKGWLTFVEILKQWPSSSSAT